jgi:hypothetical protein
MTDKKTEEICAQVVLLSASGKAPTPEAPMTSETIAEYAPSKEAVERSTHAFSNAGFQVGPMVGNSFSITAPTPTFESQFKARVRKTKKGGLECVAEDGSARCELPLKGVPAPASKDVAAVTFVPPPDFGPKNFGP